MRAIKFKPFPELTDILQLKTVSSAKKGEDIAISD